MSSMAITHELALMAKLHGACRVPPVGTPVADLPQSSLMWAEDVAMPVQSALPLWVLSGYGHGYGHGDGDGHGYGAEI